MIQQLATPGNSDVASKLLNEILVRIHRQGPIFAADFEKLALIKHFYPAVFSKREKELLYISGLFYKVDEPENMVEEVYSIFSDAITSETGKTFTPVQASA